jgi:hypothetical protein
MIKYRVTCYSFYSSTSIPSTRFFNFDDYTGTEREKGNKPSRKARE